MAQIRAPLPLAFLARALSAVRRGMVASVLGAFAPASALDFFASVFQGYTQYDAADMNEVLVLLEQTTQQTGGFNHYKVNRFDGHPANAMTLGVTAFGHWRLGLEAEFWVESFTQHEVPFDLRQAQREDRVTCQQIRETPDLGNGFFGCVEAQEAINFLPITLQISRFFPLGHGLRMAPGYGIGMLAGSAHIELSTKYYGNGGSAPDDNIRFQVWPGVNPVHKLFCDLEWRFWKRLGLESRLGWRYTRIPYITLRDQRGSSLVFSTVFQDAKDGARLYIQQQGQSGSDAIYVGTPEDARQLAETTGSRLHAVEGDFTGWFAAVKLNIYLWGNQ